MDELLNAVEKEKNNRFQKLWTKLDKGSKLDRLKLFIITDESIYYPDFILNFIKRTNDEIVGAIITKNSPSNASNEKFIFYRSSY